MSALLPLILGGGLAGYGKGMFGGDDAGAAKPAAKPGLLPIETATRAYGGDTESLGTVASECLGGGSIGNTLGPMAGWLGGNMGTPGWAEDKIHDEAIQRLVDGQRGSGVAAGAAAGQWLALAPAT
jgi:hypothetical protein